MKAAASMSIWLTILATPMGVCSLIRRGSLLRGKLLSPPHPPPPPHPLSSTSSTHFFMGKSLITFTGLNYYSCFAPLLCGWEGNGFPRCATRTLICRQSAPLHRAPPSVLVTAQRDGRAGGHAAIKPVRFGDPGAPRGALQWQQTLLLICHSFKDLPLLWRCLLEAAIEEIILGGCLIQQHKRNQ